MECLSPNKQGSSHAALTLTFVSSLSRQRREKTKSSYGKGSQTLPGGRAWYSIELEPERGTVDYGKAW